MRRIVALFLTVAFMALAGCDRKQATVHKKSTMTLQQMEDMFTNMRANTKWDVDGEMLWVTSSPTRTQQAGAGLTETGLVGLSVGSDLSHRRQEHMRSACRAC
jgi:uncharacterized lipoprotein YajG